MTKTIQVIYNKSEYLEEHFKEIHQVHDTKLVDGQVLMARVVGNKTCFIPLRNVRRLWVMEDESDG